MFLGREKTKGIVLANGDMEAEASRILNDLKIDIDPKQVVGELPVSKQQMVEIAKALSVNARILIMDEPTSALTAKEIDDLFRIIKDLRSKGCGIVYISHRLEELQHIVDRVTIMRDGQYITSMNFKDTTMDQIIANMVGREIKEQFPLPAEFIAHKAERDEEVKKVISGESDKFLVIIGPCSADNEDAVLDYTSRLIDVQEKTKDRLVIVPRIYTNKPRTTGDGYKGMLHQPDPEKRPSMAEGLHAIRHMHMRVLKETGFSTADEMLYPDNVSIVWYPAAATFRSV